MDFDLDIWVLVEIWKDSFAFHIPYSTRDHGVHILFGASTLYSRFFCAFGIKNQTQVIEPIIARMTGGKT